MPLKKVHYFGDDNPDQLPQPDEMVLLAYRDKDGVIKIAPKDKEDNPLFMHCSNGSIEIYPEYYEKIVKPLIEYHGVTTILEYTF